MILTLLASLALLQGPLPTAGLRLEGTFIQYADWMTRLTNAEWEKELDAARAAGLHTIIVQWLVYGDRDYMADGAADTAASPAAGHPVDPTSAILRYADRHGMRVYLGLTVDDDWGRRWKDPAYLDSLAAASQRVAERAWRRYGTHRSLAGWYIPGELWDAAMTDAQIASVRTFLRRVSDGCKALSGGKTVAIAPYFVGLLPPRRVAALYGSLLTDSGVDIVMLQDGVGARGWDAQIEERVIPYFQAFRDACLTAGVELWSDLECFRQRDRKTGDFEPASADRILDQLAGEAPFVRRFVTFDFFHYMSPSRGDAAAALHDAYTRKCVEAEFLPHLGRSMQVDPTFSYYRDRSPESIADEIRAAGYSVVHYVVVNDGDVDRNLVEAFRRRGIGVWYETFTNGVYRTAGLPDGWASWRMVLRSDLAAQPYNDGFTRLCLNNAGYRAWKKASMARVLRGHKFLGVDLAEPHWPEYPGTTSPVYACFCQRCREAFLKAYPEAPGLPDVLDPNSPRHPSRNPDLWNKWLRFRQASLTDFLNDLVNGPGGLRETCPDRLVCTWTLALLGNDGPQRVRDIHGEDAAEVVQKVKPDVHCLQTHWPDWIRADLDGDYVRGYQPFLDAIRAVAPDLPVVFQADIGSQMQNRRSWEWIRLFENTSRRMGAQSAMSYEYFIGGYMYDDPPAIAEARRQGSEIRLVTTKRLDTASAGKVAAYTTDIGRVEAAAVDANVVTLRVAGVPPNHLLRITVRGISDAADRRLFTDKPPCVLTEQTIRVR